MKIAFIDTLGLTYDGSTLDKRGLGGSESAVIRMAQELTKIGFEVTVFNDCTSDDSMPDIYDNVLYLPLDDTQLDLYQFDVCVVSRSVKPIAEDWPVVAKAKHVCLWMHDTFCEGDNQIETLINQGKLNEIFTLSDWHTGYVTHCDHGVRRNFDILKNHIFMTRNGIGNMNPGWIDVREKDPNLFVFNASVTKGMVPLVKQIWPKVKQRIPNAHLKIVGGYYKFREAAGPDQQEKDWAELMIQYGHSIEFTGVITQQEISDILRKASYMIYPVGFPETFGISTLEALAHNVPLITCRFGALEETAIDLASWKINYPVEPNWALPWLNQDSQVDIFVDKVIEAYNNPYLHQQKMYACNQVKNICGWDTVALQWKQHLYHKLGEYLPVEEYRKVTKINTKVRKVFNRRFLNKEEIVEPQQGPFSPINIVTPVYNAEKYIARCIQSVAQQNYPNYIMHIIDDCSTDNTAKVAQDYIDSLPEEIRYNFRLHLNTENLGAVRNQVKTIEQECGHDIVMLLDGDDWLVNDPNLFHKYNNLYNDGAQFTYGSCWSIVDNIPLIAQEYPPEVKFKKTYRNYKFNWNMPYTHLRTFSAFLMHIHLDLYGHNAFKDKKGDWLKAGGDTAVFYAMLEMADPEGVVCIPDIVYNYNDANPLNDYKVNAEEQNKTAEQVISAQINQESEKNIIETLFPTPFLPGQIDLRPL
jgi:glycosyltransferase involved in cell wall biosynthesis